MVPWPTVDRIPERREVVEARTRSQAAVFLDRDGTLIEPVHHLTDPEKVRLIEGSGAAILRLRAAGFACVVVTNQSVVGRGMIDEQGLAEIHRRLEGQLAREGTRLDAIYYSTAVPTTQDRTRIETEDRKPGPGLLHRAARDLDLDLGSSWIVGDMVSDVLAGVHAGCRGAVWLRGRLDQIEILERGAEGGATRLLTANDLGEATDLILGRQGTACESS